MSTPEVCDGCGHARRLHFARSSEGYGCMTPLCTCLGFVEAPPASEPDSHVFRCEACGWTSATGTGAVQHELSTHGGAQTCWRTIDRDALAALDPAAGRPVPGAGAAPGEADTTSTREDPTP